VVVAKNNAPGVSPSEAATPTPGLKRLPTLPSNAEPGGRKHPRQLPQLGSELLRLATLRRRLEHSDYIDPEVRGLGAWHVGCCLCWFCINRTA
jgi:hypothetical protein